MGGFWRRALGKWLIGESALEFCGLWAGLQELWVSLFPFNSRRLVNWMGFMAMAAPPVGTRANLRLQRLKSGEFALRVDANQEVD